MKNIWVRIIAAVFTAEALPIFLLVALVAVFSTGEAAGDQALATSLGAWVGPIGGAIATFLMSWWAVKYLQANHIAYGAFVGFLTGALDASIIFASGEAFQMLFAFSWVGRFLAGTFGGAMAARLLTR